MEEKNSEKKERKMRDSGIPWIGEVPEKWKVMKIGHCFRLKNEKNFLPENKVQLLSLYTGIGVFPTNSEKAKTSGNHAQTVNGYKIVHKNDIVVNIILAWMGSIGVSDYDGVVSPAYDVYTPDLSKVIPRYAHYVFRTDGIAGECLKYGRGIMMMRWRTYSPEFKQIKIPFPSLKEQHRIADFLDSKCSEIDALIENLRARMESAKEYKKAVITEAVTKGLDKDAKMKDSGVEWIGEIPEGWKVVRFKHIASIKSNLVQPDKYMKYPQIAPDNIEKDTGRLLSHQTVEESGVISGNHLFYRGQILYSKIRPNLNKLTVAPFDGLCSADMYPIESKLPTLFMVYSMLSTYFVSQVSLIIQDRVKMPKINQEELGGIKVAVPSQQEMLTIADYLDSKCSEIDALLQNYEYQIATLEEYKKSLIYEYVTGKKEVPEA